MAGAELSQWEPSSPVLAKLSQFLRTARDVGNKARVPEGVPLVGGMGAGDAVLNRFPEAADRLAYNEPLTTGKGMTLHLQPDIEASVLDLMPSPGGKGAGLAGKVGKRLEAKVGGSDDLVRALSDKVKRDAELRAARDAAKGQAATEAGYTPHWNTGSTAKTQRPWQDMTSQRVPDPSVKKIERVPWDIEKAQGGTANFVPGDRTVAGELLTHVNETKLPQPVKLEGGPDYMLAHGHGENPEIWAGGRGAISAATNSAIQGMEKAGADRAYMMYSPMGPLSMNHPTMMMDTVLQKLAANPVGDRSLMRALNEHVKKTRPDFLGLEHPEVGEQLRDFKNANLRKDVLAKMDSAAFQQGGFPDITAIRKAMTNPQLLEHIDDGSMGYAVGLLDPNRAMVPKTKSGHATYEAGMGGVPVGGFDNPVPWQLVFKDFYDQQRAMGKETKHDLYTLSKQRPTPVIDQEMVDRVKTYLENLRK